MYESYDDGVVIAGSPWRTTLREKTGFVGGWHSAPSLASAAA
jgi:hypothetical protein